MTSIPTDLQGCLDLLPDNDSGAITAESMRAVVQCQYDMLEAVETMVTNVANAVGNLSTQVQANADAIGALQGDVGGLVSTVADLHARLDALDGGGP